MLKRYLLIFCFIHLYLLGYSVNIGFSIKHEAAGNALIVNASNVNPNCLNPNFGSIVITGSNGILPLTVTNSLGTVILVVTAYPDTISNVPANNTVQNYVVTDFASDNTPLSASFSPALSFNASILFQQDQNSCIPGTAYVKVTESGGTGPYTIRDITGGSNLLIASNVAFPYDITSLLVQTYTFQITDALGCTSPLPATILDQSVKPTLVITPLTQNYTCTNTSLPVFFNGNFSPTSSFILDDPSNNPPINLSVGSTAFNAALPGKFVLTVNDPVTGCSNKDSVIVIADTAKPNLVAINPNAQLNCINNGSVILNASSSTLGATVTSWQTPNGNVPSASFNFTANVAGTYTVNVTNPVNGCTRLRNFNVVNNQTFPLVTITPANLNLSCTTATINLSANIIANSTYSWSGPVGTNIVGANTANPIINSPGKYVLVVTNNSNGCIGKDSVVITGSNLKPNFQTAPPFYLSCNSKIASVKAVLNPSLPNTQITWTGPNIISGNGTLSIIAGALGNYKLKVKNLDNQCADSIVYTVSPSPAVVISPNMIPITACTQGKAEISITSGVPPYNITLGGSTIATNATPYTAIFNNLNGGPYQVNVLDSNGCSASQTVVVNTVAAMSALQMVPYPTCANATTGKLVINNVFGGAPPYTFDINGTPFPGPLPIVYNNLNTGTYPIIVTDNYGCTFTTSATIGTVANPFISGISTANVTCNGLNNGTATVNASGNGPFSYVWFPTNVNGQGSAAISGLKPNFYSVLVTDTNGCASLASASVTEPLPILLSLSGDSTFCNGAQVGLSANVSGGKTPYKYQWSNINQNAASIYFVPTSTQTINLKVTDANGCQKTAGKLVSLILPDAEFTTSDRAGCPSYCVAFTNLKTQKEYVWDFGDGTFSNDKNPKHCYPKSGKYDIKLTVKDKDGCSNTLLKSQYIEVFNKPNTAIEATPSITTIKEPDIQFNGYNDGSVTKWYWQFDDELNSNSNLQNPKLTYTQPGKKKVILMATNEKGCNDTAYSEVIIEYVVTFFAPNAFTPNDDIYNGKWMIKGIGLDESTYHLKVFNRLGLQLFESRDMNEGWDGKINGKALQDDVYLWQVEMKDKNGNAINRNGRVSILK
jgi:gliding motility-associated-like protein